MARIEDLGEALVKGLFRNIQFDVTEYCNAAVDASYEYTLQEFKEACKKAGIDWVNSWENILYD